MLLAMLVLAVQMHMGIVLPDYVQVFGISAGVALSAFLFVKAESGEDFAKLLWFLDLSVGVVWGQHYKMVSLVGGMLVLPVVVLCIEAVARRLRGVQTWVLIGGVLLVLMDVALVTYWYPKFSANWLEGALVPLVYSIGNGETLLVLEPSIGSGDFVVGVLLFLLLRLPFVYYPFVFTVSFAVSGWLADTYTWWLFPFLLVYVPVIFTLLLLVEVVKARRVSQKS